MRKFTQGQCVKVKPAYDIPLVVRSGLPSTGIITDFYDEYVMVEIEGATVPYKSDELEPC